MRIDTTGLHASRKMSSGAPDAAFQAETAAQPAGGSDNVTVSSRARLLKMGRSALQSTPEIRADVVESARVKLESDDDVYDGGEIARAMVDAISVGEGR